MTNPINLKLAAQYRQSLIQSYEAILTAEERMAKNAVLDVMNATHQAAADHAKDAVKYYSNMADEMFALKLGLD